MNLPDRTGRDYLYGKRQMLDHAAWNKARRLPIRESLQKFEIMTLGGWNRFGGADNKGGGGALVLRVSHLKCLTSPRCPLRPHLTLASAVPRWTVPAARCMRTGLRWQRPRKVDAAAALWPVSCALCAVLEGCACDGLGVRDGGRRHRGKSRIWGLSEDARAR